MSGVSYTFNKNHYDERDGTHTEISHTYVTGEDSTWMPIMLQFAAFLEGCGYVGVYQRVQNMIDFEDDYK